MDQVSVVTLTRGRPKQVARAIASVCNQDFDGVIEHIIVIDDDMDSFHLLQDYSSTATRQIVLLYAGRNHFQRHYINQKHRAFIYPRIAKLFNLGVKACSGRYVAFLDDDNEYCPNHISTLYRFAQSEDTSAVHSGRFMINPDGTPYLQELFPGVDDLRAASAIYDEMCDKGVWIRGTNILLDQTSLDLENFINSTVSSGTVDTYLVDQNVWFIERDLLMKIPIPEVFTSEEIDDNVCPDDKLLKELLKSGVKIKGLREPTVRYYVGGISTQGVT